MYALMYVTLCSWQYVSLLPNPENFSHTSQKKKSCFVEGSECNQSECASSVWQKTSQEKNVKNKIFFRTKSKCTEVTSFQFDSQFVVVNKFWAEFNCLSAQRP